MAGSDTCRHCFISFNMFQVSNFSKLSLYRYLFNINNAAVLIQHLLISLLTIPQQKSSAM